MNFKKILPFIFLVVLAFVALLLNKCNTIKSKQPQVTTQENVEKPASGLNRNPLHINYSKHAKCRMDCRHITANEIADILKNGTINYKKSELEGNDCRKKYAVEGYSKNQQHLRIIFAPCGDEVTVVTCIDLGVEWACDCE